MIEITQDYRRITPFQGEEPILISMKVLYLMEVHGGKDMGFWAFLPYKDGLQVHARMGPECRGKKAIDSLKSAIDWVFKNMAIKHVYAVLPGDHNPSAIVASRAGMCYTHTENSNRIFEVKKCQVY